MLTGFKAPFFELGPKAYLYGKDAVDFARAADELSRRYGVCVIYDPQYTDLYPVSQAVRSLYIFAQHMDAVAPGRGQGSVLPEAVKAAGAVGVMLNHAEKPLPLCDLRRAVERGREVGLAALVCADSAAEAAAVAQLHPYIIVAEPTELIGTGQVSDRAYVEASTKAVKDVDSSIFVLQGAGISGPDDVYRIIAAGADATGTSSAVFKAKDPIAMTELMLKAVREAYGERVSKSK